MGRGGTTAAALGETTLRGLGARTESTTRTVLQSYGRATLVAERSTDPETPVKDLYSDHFVKLPFGVGPEVHDVNQAWFSIWNGQEQIYFGRPDGDDVRVVIDRERFVRTARRVTDHVLKGKPGQKIGLIANGTNPSGTKRYLALVPFSSGRRKPPLEAMLEVRADQNDDLDLNLNVSSSFGHFNCGVFRAEDLRDAADLIDHYDVNPERDQS